MKFKMIIISVITLLVAVLGFGFIKSSSLRKIHIQKEVLINADVQEAFDQVAYLKNFPNWSPFLEADPAQKIEIKGNDGNVGAQYHWIGNNGKDVGYQEIKAIKEDQYVKMECDIQKPFEAKPTFEYTFSQEGEQVKVKQDFKLESGAIDAFFMWVFSAKKDMAKMNERGLVLLKKHIER